MVRRCAHSEFLCTAQKSTREERIQYQDTREKASFPYLRYLSQKGQKLSSKQKICLLAFPLKAEILFLFSVLAQYERIVSSMLHKKIQIYVIDYRDYHFVEKQQKRLPP
jgi:hypothetical protein